MNLWLRQRSSAKCNKLCDIGCEASGAKKTRNFWQGVDGIHVFFFIGRHQPLPEMSWVFAHSHLLGKPGITKTIQ
jgi:hypothetical protein